MSYLIDGSFKGRLKMPGLMHSVLKKHDIDLPFEKRTKFMTELIVALMDAELLTAKAEPKKRSYVLTTEVEGSTKTEGVVMAVLQKFAKDKDVDLNLAEEVMFDFIQKLLSNNMCESDIGA
jgi:hypothetical protein